MAVNAVAVAPAMNRKRLIQNATGIIFGSRLDLQQVPKQWAES